LGAVREDAVGAVRRRVGEAEWTKHARRDVREEILPRGALHGRRDEVPTVARVGEARAGGEQERVVLENREPVADRGEVPVQEELAVTQMPDAGDISSKLASRTRNTV